MSDLLIFLPLLQSLYRILISKVTHDACIQKELGDRKSASIDFVRQLLPLPKMYCEVIMSEYVHSGSSDTRGSGSTHKANNEADQRKQVSTKSSVVVAWLTITKNVIVTGPN